MTIVTLSYRTITLAVAVDIALTSALTCAVAGVLDIVIAVALAVVLMLDRLLRLAGSAITEILAVWMMFGPGWLEMKSKIAGTKLPSVPNRTGSVLF